MWMYVWLHGCGCVCVKFTAGTCLGWKKVLTTFCGLQKPTTEATHFNTALVWHAVQLMLHILLYCFKSPKGRHTRKQGNKKTFHPFRCCLTEKWRGYFLVVQKIALALGTWSSHVSSRRKYKFDSFGFKRDKMIAHMLRQKSVSRIQVWSGHPIALLSTNYPLLTITCQVGWQDHHWLGGDSDILALATPLSCYWSDTRDPDLPFLICKLQRVIWMQVLNPYSLLIGLSFKFVKYI